MLALYFYFVFFVYRCCKFATYTINYLYQHGVDTLTNRNLIMTFNQSRQIGVAGNFINQVMGNNCSVPVVGEGATILHYSDREAYEVIAVSDCGTKCTIRS